MLLVAYSRVCVLSLSSDYNKAKHTRHDAKAAVTQSEADSEAEEGKG